ncbi:two-component regulator propeller domain-containing protein [Xanthocytophaga agilis]|nr:two-component regulator propeller domain-containing protein [Xanthocytophaga agilis]
MIFLQYFHPKKLALCYRPQWLIGLVLAFLCGMQTGFSQISELSFRNLSTKQGLSNKDVHAILQDSKGFIWFATKDGLNIYNGYTIQVIQNNPKDNESLPSNDVRALAEDNEGYIWVGTYDNGLIRLNPQTRKGVIYSTATDKALTSNTIFDIHKDRNGNIWIATFGGGLVKFDVKTQKLASYQSDPGNVNGLKSSNIITIHEDKHGDLWLGTFGGGLCKFEVQKQKFSTYLNQENTDIYAIEEDREGYLWLGTYGKGLARFDKQTGKVQYFSTQTVKGLGSDFIRAIKEDNMGILWIGTEKGGGLSSFDPVRNKFNTYKQNPIQSASLSGNDINTLLLDKLGILWIGTEGTGVDQFDTQNAVFKSYISGAGTTPKFTDGAITAIYEDKAQLVWIGGTFADGLAVYAYDRLQDVYTCYKLPVTNELMGFDYTITAIAEDDIGNIWIGTAENGLYRYNKHLKTFRSFTSSNSQLSSNGVEVLYKDRKGIVWVGTYEGGLCKFDPYHETIHTYTHDPKNPASIAGNTIKVIYDDEKGKLWLGTKQNGLSVFTIAKNTFTNYQAQKNSLKSLPGNSIRAITESNGQIWIGTDAGICQFNSQSNTFKRINAQNGLPENNVCSMLSDKNGDLWISTFSKGLVRFNPKTNKFRYFTTEEGLYSNEFQQWAAHKNYDGELFFGGSRHFISFNPDKVFENPYVAPIYLTSFTLFDKKKEFAKPLYDLSVIDLDYKDNFFEFEFASLNYLNPEKNSYAFMMEGVDKDWKNVGNRRLASYTNLDPGSYTFKVKAADKYNQWNNTWASIHVVIHPAWYQTWWARISGIALVLGSILVYYRNRIRFFQRQKQILEDLVQQRTAELVQKNAEIESQKNNIEEKNIKLTEAKELIEQINEELRAINNDLEYRVEQRTHQLKVANESLLKSNQELDMFIYRASHDIKGPLASLSGLCKVAGMDVEDPKAKDYFSLLDKTCDKANHTLVRILKMYDIRNAEIYNEPVSLVKTIERLVSDIKARSAYANTQFELITTADWQVVSDKSLLSIVLHNLIENAFQYQQDPNNPYVKVYLEEVDDTIQIQIHDNGMGILENLQNKLFTMFFRGTVNSSGTGLGLYISKLAIERLGGSVQFVTGFDKETVFRIVIPKLPVAAGLALILPSEAEVAPAAE